MNPQTDLGAIARNIIDSIVYMALGTADENGNPWVSPLYFASAAYQEFYWISSPDVRHSRNIALRPQVSIVIFDSQIPIGSGQAVYIAGLAEQVTGSDLKRSLGIYNGRFPKPAEHGVQEITKQDVLAPAPYRLYRAIASEHWALDPAGHPDHRTAVTV